MRMMKTLKAARLLAAIALLAPCSAASADALQRIDQRMALKVAFHEKQKPPEMQGGQMNIGEESLLLLPEVARIVVAQYGDAELPAALSAQFAVAAGAASGDEQPADVLTVAMAHLGEGSYAVAQDSHAAMVVWFTDHGFDFASGNIVLLRVDGLPEMSEKAIVFFDIDGECPICDSDTFLFPGG